MIRLKTSLWGLFFIGAGNFSAKAQDAPPVFDPNSKPPSSDEMAQYTQMMEKMARNTTNPAYQPLYPAFEPFKKIAGKLPKRPMDIPLSEVSAFLVLPEVQQGMGLTRGWITGFSGLDTHFISPQSSNPFMGLIGGITLLGSVPVLETIWASENRLALANGHADLALKNLEETLQFVENFAVDSVFLGFSSLDITPKNAVLYAQALPQFTPRQCTQLIRLLDRWETGNGAYEQGLRRSLQQDEENAVGMIEDDGSVYDVGKEIGRRAEEASAASDNGEPSLDIGRQMETLFAPRPPRSFNPTPAAVEKRRQIAALIESDYRRLTSLLSDPFAPLPPKTEKPKELEEAFMFNFASIADDGVPELQKQRLQIRLLKAHAAIRRFQWEHDRPPHTLAELEDKTLVLDPATRTPFQYKVEGDTYTLTGGETSTRGANGEVTAAKGRYDLMKEAVPDFDGYFGQEVAGGVLSKEGGEPLPPGPNSPVPNSPVPEAPRKP